MDEFYEIDLLQFNLDLFYEKIIEIVSKNCGWMNFQRGVFTSLEERDCCLFELELETGVVPKEANSFEIDAHELFKALKSSFPSISLSKEKQQVLKNIFLEILELDATEIMELNWISENKINNNKRLKKNQQTRLDHLITLEHHEKLRKIDDQLEKLFSKSRVQESL